MHGFCLNLHNSTLRFCNLRRRAVVDALANGRFALKTAVTVKQLCFWINQHGIVLRNPLGYRV
jgi:hypothetical protein